MDKRYNCEWRSSPNARQHYGRRKSIWIYIENLIAKGIPENDAVTEVEKIK
jgi:hypothetical protein